MSIKKAVGGFLSAAGTGVIAMGAMREKKEAAAEVLKEAREWEMWKIKRREGIESSSAATARKDKGTEKILDVYGKNLANLYDQLNPKGFMAQQNLSPEDQDLIRTKISLIESAQNGLLRRYMYETSLPEERKAIDERAREKLDEILKAKTEDDLAMIEVEGAHEIDSAQGGYPGSGESIVGEEKEGGILDSLVDFIKNPAKYIEYENTPLESITPSMESYYKNQIAEFKEHYGPETWNELRKSIGEEHGIENISDMEASKLLAKEIRDKFIEQNDVGAAVADIKALVKSALDAAKAFVKKQRKTPSEMGVDTVYNEAGLMGQLASHPGQGGHVGGPGDPDITIPEMEARARGLADPTVTWSPTDPAGLISQAYAGTQTGMPVAMDAMPAEGVQEVIRGPIGKTTIELSDDVPEEAVEKRARKERLVSKIKAIIISSEPNQGAGKAWTSISGGMDDPNLTSMTVGEIHDKHGDKAFGAGQFRYRAFMIPQVKKHLNRDQKWLDAQVFDIPFQNILFSIGIEDAGINEFLNGTKTAAQFQKSLHTTWRALPKTVGTMKGDISDTHGNIVQTSGPRVGSELMSAWTSQ